MTTIPFFNLPHRLSGGLRQAVLLALCILLQLSPVRGTDSTVLRVHCFYGSRPLRAYKSEEAKWFGGLWGGHVSVSWDSSRVLSFVHNGKFHWFARKHKRHSRFLGRELRRYSPPPTGRGHEIKQATVYIPISAEQKQRLDSIAAVYLTETPYDYAFFGMRCAAATYEILGQLRIVEAHPHPKTWRKMFYPRKFRRHLFRRAERENWRIERQEGTPRRKWDWDFLFR